MIKFLMFSLVLLTLLLTTGPAQAWYGGGFGFGGYVGPRPYYDPPVYIGGYRPYSYYGLYGPYAPYGYYGPRVYGPHVWVPGHWKRRWTPYGWGRVWIPGHWR